MLCHEQVHDNIEFSLGNSKLCRDSPITTPYVKLWHFISFFENIYGILWTLKLVLSESSLRCCEQLKYLFQVVFGDSKIAEAFQFGKTKCGHKITCGIL